jgi:hypothetical protein
LLYKFAVNFAIGMTLLVTWVILTAVRAPVPFWVELPLWVAAAVFLTIGGWNSQKLVMNWLTGERDER